MGSRAALTALLLGMAGLAIGEETLGRMGTVEVTSGELTRMLASRGLGAGATLSIDELDKLVRDELARRMILSEARAKGWDKKPEVVDRLERARDDALIASYVGELARPAADYPAEADVAAAYEANKPAFLTARQYRVAQIFLAINAGESADGVMAKARDIAAKAAAKPADFAKLALQHSHHRESAVRGGELGWVPERQLLPEVREAIQGLAKGAVSNPIRSSTGIHIVHVMERREPVTRALDEVRAQIVDSLRARKAEAASQQYLSDLTRRTPITVNQVELSRYAKPAK